MLTAKDVTDSLSVAKHKKKQKINEHKEEIDHFLSSSNFLLKLDDYLDKGINKAIQNNKTMKGPFVILDDYIDFDYVVSWYFEDVLHLPSGVRANFIVDQDILGKEETNYLKNKISRLVKNKMGVRGFKKTLVSIEDKNPTSINSDDMTMSKKVIIWIIKKDFYKSIIGRICTGIVLAYLPIMFSYIIDPDFNWINVVLLGTYLVVLSVNLSAWPTKFSSNAEALINEG